VFRSKNLSSTYIALIIASVLSVIASLLTFWFTHSAGKTISTVLILFASSYFLTRYFLERFVYRKIKLIYKFISHTKASLLSESEDSQPATFTIDDVSEDVESWALQQKTAIEKLESNEEFRKEFLMNLSHELKTPLFSIQGYIATLLDGELDNKEVNRKFLKNAAKSADRLGSLVQDVDLISKMESNRLPLAYSTFSIQNLIKEVFDELGPKAVVKNISMRMKSSSDGETEVSADKDKIKQVLINLIENGIRYGRDDGEVSAGIYDVDEACLIEISDNGMGIPEEAVHRVFERFYRTDKARTRENAGSGLGLAIVKHIVEAHGQSISCRSRLDVGSTFGFTLEKEKF